MKENDVGKILKEITEQHSEKIKNNESFAQLLNKISQENDKKNEILEKLANASKMNYEYSKGNMDYAVTLKSIIMNVDTRLSALEIATAHIEKDNEKWMKLVDNLQQQIDTMAYDIYVDEKDKKDE
tara:strand:+ start:148 stop:525 length:378 start_codon:yes stop_codon:yes gene_type:complete